MKKIRYYYLPFFFTLLLIGCDYRNDNHSLPDGLLGKTEYTVGVEGGEISLVVTSSKKVTVLETPEWIKEGKNEVFGENYVFNMEVEDNISLSQRAGEIKFSTGAVANVVQRPFAPYVASTNFAGLEEVIQKTELETVTIIDTDGKLIDVKGKTTDPRAGRHANTNSPFSRIYDGAWDKGDVFYSNGFTKEGNTFPEPMYLDFYLSDSENSLDHIMYYATYNNSLGAWGEIEVWASTDEVSRDSDDLSTFKKVGEMDCEFKWTSGKSLVTKIPLSVKLSGIRVVRIFVKTAQNSGNFVRVAAQEVEIYEQLPLDFDSSDLFTDNSCTVIKEGVTVEDINNYSYPLFKNVANYIHVGLYPVERVVTVEDEVVSTDIHTIFGEILVVMAECETGDVSIDIVNDTDEVLATYSISNGANMIKGAPEGRIKVRNSGVENAKLNFLNGRVVL